MNSPSKQCSIAKLSLNSIKLISHHIPFIKLLNVFRYSKKLQSILYISIFYYKKYFVQKKIHINFTTVTVKELLFLFNTEFNNFNKTGDEKVLEKIVKELIKEGKSVIVNKRDNDDILRDYKNKNSYCEKFQNMLMKKIIDNTFNNKLIALYLYSKADDIFEMGNNIGPNFEQIRLKPCSFPYLKILKFDTCFKIPISLLLNLTKLNIYINSKKYLFLINDINANFISLKNLKHFKIKRKVNDNLSYEIRNFSPFLSTKQFKINIPNIESLIINVDINEDLYLLKEYFKINSIVDKINEKMSFFSLYNYFRQAIFNYEFPIKTNLFKCDMTFRKIRNELLLNCEMNKSVNGLKNYYFRRNISKRMKNIYTISESYTKDNSNSKKMTLYLNRFGLKNIVNPALIKDVNYIALLSNDKIKLKRKKIVNLFNINENNYSIQHILIDLGADEKYFIKLINNIEKFKVLKNLLIKDYIVKIDNLLRLIKNVSKLKLLRTMKIYFKGKLNNKSLNLIKKSIPFISFKREIDSDIMEFSFYNNKNLS